MHARALQALMMICSSRLHHDRLVSAGIGCPVIRSLDEILVDLLRVRHILLHRLNKLESSFKESFVLVLMQDHDADLRIRIQTLSRCAPDIAVVCQHVPILGV